MEKRKNINEVKEKDFKDLIKSYLNEDYTMSIFLENKMLENIIAFAIGILLSVFGYYLYLKINGDICDLFLSVTTYIKAVVVFIINMAIYKIIFLFLYIIFSKNKLNSIKISFKNVGILPSVFLKEAQSKIKYVLNFLIPFIVSGFGPILLGIHLYKKFYLVIGFVTIIALSFDLLKVLKIIIFREKGLFINDPTNNNLIVFTKI